MYSWYTHKICIAYFVCMKFRFFLLSYLILASLVLQLLFLWCSWSYLYKACYITLSLWYNVTFTNFFFPYCPNNWEIQSKKIQPISFFMAIIHIWLNITVSFLLYKIHILNFITQSLMILNILTFSIIF